MTDSDEEVKAVYDIARRYSRLEKFELLPFKKLCLTKYQSLNIPFPLADVPECSPERIKELYAMLGIQ